MLDETWAAVDEMLGDLLIGSDPVLDAALADSAEAGLPAINVTPNQGKLLHLIARLIGARNILEIGTLGGYSTIWLARALPADGRLITLEYDPACISVAEANVARAGLASIVQVRCGPALDTLLQLAVERREPFDFVFIDADKENTPAYFDWSLKLTRPGGVVIVDNVVRRGAILNVADTDADVRGVRRFLERLAVEKSVEATAIQTVGSKGHDGFAVVVVNRSQRPASD